VEEKLLHQQQERERKRGAVSGIIRVCMYVIYKCMYLIFSEYNIFGARRSGSSRTRKKQINSVIEE
jgi:hypothetical protein